MRSNRSVALLQLNKVTKALADAETSIDLQPDWHKAHFRRGAALEGMGRLDEALSAFRDAAARAPDNVEAQDRIRALNKTIQRQASGKDAERKGSTFKF
ncbi:hypothetical protein H632_c1165p1 [Helicosporidium sp. ATCC 50920]|nr:hypothetical protein H632_c1165p1 [Helicosporidium sp. ATCC 50920]|eukprot:KDD74639.1 hypothetical protein H632_c1165p1 [Helicosporidium sp. ATCC 50920]